jgi:hypothetical protein
LVRRGRLTLKNPGPTAIYRSGLLIDTSRLEMLSGNEITIDQIPPYGYVQVPVKFKPLKVGRSILTINYGRRSVSQTLEVIPLTLLLIILLLGGSIILTFNWRRVKKIVGKIIR